LGSRLDLSGSRDVIGHVIIRFPVDHFLLVVLWTQWCSPRDQGLGLEAPRGQKH